MDFDIWETLNKAKELFGLSNFYEKESQSKRLYVNQKTYDIVISRLDFKPENLYINNNVPDYKGVVIDPKKPYDPYVL